MKESCELTLWGTYESLRDEVYECLRTGDYLASLHLMAQLRKPVDEFFAGVEVLSRESRALKENRVGILQHVTRLFLAVADFSKFSI